MKKLKNQFNKRPKIALEKKVRLNKSAQTYMDERPFRGEVVFDLIKQGAGVNVKDSTGVTCLLWALSYGDLDLSCYLVKHGADVNKVVPYSKWTAPCILCDCIIETKQSMTLLEEILKNHKKINLLNLKKMSALLTALNFGKFKFAEILVRHGADINVSMPWDKKPLLLHLIKTTLTNAKLDSFVAMLFDHGYDLDKKYEGLNTYEHLQSEMSRAYGSHWVDIGATRRISNVINLIKAEPERRAQKMRDLVRRNVVLQRDIPDSEMPHKMKFIKNLKP